MAFADLKLASKRKGSDGGRAVAGARVETRPLRGAMRGPAWKNVGVVVLALLLAVLGGYNLVLKATWTMLDDGVFWVSAPEGLMASQVAPGGPGSLAGIKAGDILLALDGSEVLTAEQLEERLSLRSAGQPVRYSLLRAAERRALELRIQPLSPGNVTLFYYLSVVGFFSLAIGTIVMLRRPTADRAALHFYAICLLFFLTYSTSYAGKLNWADWLLLWADHLAILFLPPVFLHFCLCFPEPRSARVRAWAVPAAYLPALVLTGASLCGQLLFVGSGGSAFLWRVLAGIDRWKPFYFGLLFAVAFGVLLHAYRHTHSLTARRQMKWLVWGTGFGVLPFFVFYAIPFALGHEPRFTLELLGYVPLALIPLALAYAVVKHRLMDMELIFRRTLVSLLATAALIGICLLLVSLSGTFLADDEPHRTSIAILSTLVVVLLFPPLKHRIQDLIDRLSLRERYRSRQALLRLSQDLNASLDLGSTTERLQEDVMAALGVGATAIFLPDRNGAFPVFTSRGCDVDAAQQRLPAGGPLLRKLAGGEPVNTDAAPEAYPEAKALNLSYYFPCRAKGVVIGVLGVGRKGGGLDPLNSEEVDLLQALAGQAATAFMNGRLYQSLREKAEAFERLTQYNESILESMDSGILVLDLEGRIARWNRAIEALYGRRRGEVLGLTLAEVFPEAFLEALRSSLVMDEREEIAHIYKLHLVSAQGRNLRVNVSVAPFQVDSGERHGSLLIVDDVTARVRLEEQLQHAEKMASVGMLAAGVAHEVNTPLAGISSYTQLLREQVANDDPRAALLDKIEKQTFRAAKIVNSLLNFSRSGGADMEALDVNKVLLDVLSLLEHQLDKSNIKLRKELFESLPPIRGNENRLQQVFFNLILNARDAMPSGGWLTLATHAEEGATVVVEVRDTGVGIKREDIKRIYDPFFTTKGMGRGTGLGLSVSYGIVQELGGAIFVDSTPGQGTCFQVTLPARAVAGEARAASTHS